jgi:hypothetical protein
MPKSGVEQEARIKQALEDLETGKIQYICEASRVHDVPYNPAIALWQLRINPLETPAPVSLLNWWFSCQALGARHMVAKPRMQTS